MNEELETFSIKKEPVLDIISIDDLLNNLENQFRFLPNIGVDRNDYVKYFMLNYIGVSEKDFPDIYGTYLNDDNRENFYLFLSKIQYHLADIFGIRFDQESNYLFKNIYNVYLFTMVNPDLFIVDYISYYHFYKDRYNIIDFYKNYKVNSNIKLGDIFEIDPIKHVNNVRDILYKEIKDKKQFNMLSYNERFSVMMEYIRNIFGDMEEFDPYEMYKKALDMNPCDNYEFLNEQITVFNAFRFESFELFVEEFYKRNFDTKYQEVYLNEKIITPFFKKIDRMDYYVNRAMAIE